jgi:hypothetical protein
MKNVQDEVSVIGLGAMGMKKTTVARLSSRGMTIPSEPQDHSLQKYPLRLGTTRSTLPGGDQSRGTVRPGHSFTQKGRIVMTTETLRGVLLWCTVINYGIINLPSPSFFEFAGLSVQLVDGSQHSRARAYLSFLSLCESWALPTRFSALERSR